MLGTPDPNLLNIPLFRGLSSAELTHLGTFLHHTTIPAGGHIISLGQPGQSAYILLTGAVKVEMEQPNGTNVILAILGPGQVLGEMSLTDSLARSATVTALEPSCFFAIANHHLQACLHTMPTLASNLMRILSVRLRLANAHIQALATLDIGERVAHQLLAFAHEYGQTLPDGAVTIPLRLTQSDLADLVGSSRVRVNQVLRTCMQHNCLSIDRQYHITIHNYTVLAQCCQHGGRCRH